eukprot:CAMPEP_0174251702 /NCGR_PEP_ID=MMETSP0439-20130205/1437_1 /TAXON_ID=0 /ORGANISM="Stereomyxa ramosa, Strain Chinc5" /LENGTH=424 /DNA_ID=CAMNT_0015332095 /DNA_START=60 /DNA_END=1331 /DNA_ORIENTATION=+
MKIVQEAVVALIFIFMASSVHSALTVVTGGWEAHVLSEEAIEGAEGIRGEDLNYDGLLDVVVIFKDSQQVIAYQHPGHHLATGPWDATLVDDSFGSFGEDASPIDLDGDGNFDIVVCQSGNFFEEEQTRVVGFISDGDDFFSSDWELQVFSDAPHLQWVYSIGLDVDNDTDTDVVIGARGSNGIVAYLRSPANNKEDLSNWEYIPISDATSVVELIAIDLDEDGYKDVVVTDSEGLSHWFRRPPDDDDVDEGWQDLPIGVDVTSEDGEAKDGYGGFGDIDGDDLDDFVVATFYEDDDGNTGAFGITIHPRIQHDEGCFFCFWGNSFFVAIDSIPEVKAVAAEPAYIDDDDGLDVVFTCLKEENVDFSCVGVLRQSNNEDGWKYVEVSGSEGLRFDAPVLFDVDGDGDIDIVVVEQFENEVGVVW